LLTIQTMYIIFTMNNICYWQIVAIYLFINDI